MLRHLLIRRLIPQIRHVTSSSSTTATASSSSTVPPTSAPFLSPDGPLSDLSASLPALASPAAPTDPTTPTHHLITLIRSPLNLPSYSIRTLESLGLRKRYQSVLHPFSPTVAGHILRVKEIVRVKNVSEEEGKRWRDMSRSEGSGVVVSGRVYGGGRMVGREGEKVGGRI